MSSNLAVNFCIYFFEYFGMLGPGKEWTLTWNPVLKLLI